jgi:hypothetical protein
MNKRKIEINTKKEGKEKEAREEKELILKIEKH